MTRPGVRSRGDDVLVFVFLGPLVGWAVFFLPVIIPVLADPSPGNPGLLDVVYGGLMVLGLTLSAAYVVGFLPAWLTGLAWVRLAGRPPLHRVLLCVATGAGLSAVVGIGALPVALRFAAIGVAAALTCSLVALADEKRALRQR